MTLATLALLIHLRRQDLETYALERKLNQPEIRIERKAVSLTLVPKMLFSWLYMPPPGIH